MACSVKNLDGTCATEVGLENKFVEVAKGGDPKADGRTMSQEKVETWLVKAGVDEMSKADVANAFKKIGKSNISYSEFVKMISDLATSNKVDLKTVKGKLEKS